MKKNTQQNKDDMQPLNHEHQAQHPDALRINTLGSGHLSAHMLNGESREPAHLHHANLTSICTHGATVHALATLTANTEASSSELFFNRKNLPHLMVEEPELLPMNNLIEARGKPLDLAVFHSAEHSHAPDSSRGIEILQVQQNVIEEDEKPQALHAVETHRAADKLHSTLNENARAMPHEVDYHHDIRSASAAPLIDMNAEANPMPALRTLQVETSSNDLSSLSLADLIVNSNDALMMDTPLSERSVFIDLSVGMLDESQWHHSDLQLLPDTGDISATEMSNLIDQLLLSQPTDMNG